MVNETLRRKKISSRNEFELCYIRHQYFRKASYTPEIGEVDPYLPIVQHFALKTFFMYKNLFHLVGFESEDLINIGRIHLISFLGLFSLEKMPEKYRDFTKLVEEKNKEKPTNQEVLNKNQANFTMFLKQRMEDVVRICRQKARNIKGLPTEEYQVFAGEDTPPESLRELLEDHEKFGYRKVDIATFKKIKKKGKFSANVFKLGNVWYAAVPIEKKQLTLSDFAGAGIDPHDNFHNMTPERMFFNREEEEYWSTKQEEFNQYSSLRKIRTVKSFIEKNKNNPQYKEEVRAARKLLKEIV